MSPFTDPSIKLLSMHILLLSIFALLLLLLLLLMVELMFIIDDMYGIDKLGLVDAQIYGNDYGNVRLLYR